MAKNSRAKRKDKPAPTVIEFDDAGRKDFLTGFHKRKVERKNKYLEKKMLREKEERREARAARREDTTGLKERMQRIEKINQFIKDPTKAIFAEDAESDNDADLNDESSTTATATAVQKESTQYEGENIVSTVTIISEFDPQNPNGEEDNANAWWAKDDETKSKSKNRGAKKMKSNPGKKSALNKVKSKTIKKKK